MSCAASILSLLIYAVLPSYSSGDNTKISSRLPQHILMNTSIHVINPPLRMDILSVRWAHYGRLLVEYKDGNLTFHSSLAMMSMEQLTQGNISLTLVNITRKDGGNYTCVVQYGGVVQTAIYTLVIETDRIILLNITPKNADVSLVRGNKTKRVLYVYGNAYVTARPGDNVTLPCSFKTETHIELSLLNVRWSKDGVTKYFSNRTCCDLPGYDISEEDLENGKAPLPLINVQETDAGVYTCSIKYDTLEGSRSTTFLVNGQPLKNTPTGRSSQTAPVVILEDGVSVVPESAPQYRTLKYSLVSGVVAITGLVAIFVYFCFEG